MADKHSLNYDVRELKLGASFTNNKSSQYHTIKYDFKPASVDVNKMATVDVGTNHQVTVTVPHLDGAGVPQTVFKGSQRPYAKECVLIIDRVTGEITLEKLSSNIQVKKTRQESVAKARPLTPVASELTNTTQRSTSRTRVATNRRTHTPAAAPAAPSSSQAPARYGAQKTPPNMVRSPQRFKSSPPQAAPWSGGGNSTLASLPMIGLDDLAGPAPAAAPAPAPPLHNGFTPAPAPHNGYPPAAPARPHYPPERPDHRAPDRADHRAQDRADHRAQDRAEHRAPEHRAPEHRAPEHRPQEHRAPEYRPPEHRPPNPQINVHPPQDDSSSSSSSDSDSDSGSDSDDNPGPSANSGAAANPALPRDVLNDDLCLSESGSDSD